MATNRRRDEEPVRMGVLIRAVLICAAIAGLGLGYVRQSALQLEMGRRIAGTERRRADLVNQIETLKATEAVLLSRPQLLARVERMGLNLTNAAPSQRLYVALPRRAVPASPGLPVPPAMASGAGAVPTISPAMTPATMGLMRGGR